MKPLSCLAALALCLAAPPAEARAFHFCELGTGGPRVDVRDPQTLARLKTENKRVALCSQLEGLEQLRDIASLLDEIEQAVNAFGVEIALVDTLGPRLPLATIGVQKANLEVVAAELDLSGDVNAEAGAPPGVDVTYVEMRASLHARIDAISSKIVQAKAAIDAKVPKLKSKAKGKLAGRITLTF